MTSQDRADFVKEFNMYSVYLFLKTGKVCRCMCFQSFYFIKTNLELSISEGPLPSVLQEVDLPIVNNKECENMYERAGYR